MLPNTAILYRQNATRGATPVGLVVILYEEIIRSLQKALSAIEKGNVEQRSLELTHVLGIIGYLHAVLDFDKGKGIALKLASVYNSARDRVFQANIDPRPESIQRLIDEFSSLAAAWREVDRQIGEAPVAAAESTTYTEAEAPEDVPVARWQG
jgi:flagellar secretion chaperone FliS